MLHTKGKKFIVKMRSFLAFRGAMSANFPICLQIKNGSPTLSACGIGKPPFSKGVTQDSIERTAAIL